MLCCQPLSVRAQLILAVPNDQYLVEGNTNLYYPFSLPGFTLRFQLIRRNLIRSVDGALDSSGFPIGVRPWSCAAGIIEESVIDLNSLWNGPPIWQIGCGSLAYLKNQISAGTLIQGWVRGADQYADELAPLIDFAIVGAF
ncbi:MAG: hypothetical protein ACREIC_09830 [Limisphaerales bacterium]